MSRVFRYIARTMPTMPRWGYCACFRASSIEYHSTRGFCLSSLCSVLTDEFHRSDFSCSRPPTTSRSCTSAHQARSLQLITLLGVSSDLMRECCTSTCARHSFRLGTNPNINGIDRICSRGGLMSRGIAYPREGDSVWTSVS
jgi:hypothetical protein